MVVDIEKIIVKDRIRKDFGDIRELADDIRQNGLINPPVVNKEYELLAGERRLRACISLGWKQIEIRMMDTRDAEHELDVEISENEVRKDFSKAERADYMKRLLRIEQAKAKERQATSTGGTDPQLKEIFPEAGGQARDKTAQQFGISGKTMEKELSIVEHKDLLTPSDFADWDEGKLSTNKAFQKIMAQLRDLKEERDYLQYQLENAEPTVNTVEVVPDDYEELKKKAKEASAWKMDYEKQQNKVLEKQKQILELQDEIKKLQEQTVREQSNNDMIASSIMFATQCKNFIESVGGYVFLSEHLMELPERERKGYQISAQAVHDWAQVVLNNIERSKHELLGTGAESTEE